MRRKTILKAEHWLAINIYWLAVFYLYYIIAYWGPQEFFAENIIKSYMKTNYIHLEIILQAVLFGSLFYLTSIIVNNSKIKRKSFGVVILTHSILYLLSIILAGVIVFFVFLYFEIYPEKELFLMQEMLSHHFFISLLLYISLAILLLNFIMEVDKKFGPGNLFRLSIGRYHKPREENRIFMFLDLKNSTGITEQLGHQIYSRFIRDCFHDLTDLVIRYRAEIYQFVGDEVVLSWGVDNGRRQNNCLNLFFAFQQTLHKNEHQYLKKYNVVPIFKAGMDAGVVTVSEIGDIKREIAYHGDVLNTAARIQEQCSVYSKLLLISDKLNDLVSGENGYFKSEVGNIKLRGKKKEIKLYSIELNQPS